MSNLTPRRGCGGGKRKELEPEQELRIANDLLAGTAVLVLAKRFGVTPKRIHEAAGKHGLVKERLWCGWFWRRAA